MIRAPTFILLAAIALAACSGPSAPEEAGVCWRGTTGATGKVTYAPLARGVGSMETCAVLLEALRLQGTPQVSGAYQGYFLFLDADKMTSARHSGGVRWPIFQPPQRKVIDRDIRRMLAEHGGKMPAPDDFRLEHQQ